MPHIVKLEDGTEIETLTAEEAAEKTQAEIDRVAAEKQAEIDKEREERVAEQEERAAEQEELKKLREKDMNFERVRKKAEGKGQDTEEITKKIDEVNKRLDAVVSQPLTEVKSDFITKNIGVEKEKVDLFEYYFKRLGAEAKTKEEVLKASEEAFTLVTGKQYQPNLDSQVYKVGASQNYREQNNSAVSEESKAIGKIFGNTEKELADYKKKKGNN